MTEPGGNSGSRVTVVSGGGAAATVAPPSRIGRYAIEGLLGTGGMAVVYLARDPVLGRAVALKVMRVDGDEPGASRLVREGQALARISHPGVISVYEVGREADGTIYIAMERIVGATLAAWLETPRAPHEILRVFAAAGRGLSAAHAAGLVHRDFKPENAMVGDDGRVCVLDFGLAQPVRGAGPDADHDRVAGTPAYMSPEQWRGERAGAPAPAAPPGLTTPAAPATAPHAAPAWLRPHGDGARNGASLPATRRRRSPRAPVPRGPRPAVRCPDRPHGC